METIGNETLSSIDGKEILPGRYSINVYYDTAIEKQKNKTIRSISMYEKQTTADLINKALGEAEITGLHNFGMKTDNNRLCKVKIVLKDENGIETTFYQNFNGQGFAIGKPTYE